MRQKQLLKFQNPLLSRLGESFFQNLPTTPGVYKMFSQNSALLYVGKAKSLRSRLFSYKRAQSGSAPRKVIRLLKLVYRIEFELLETEEKALLRENELLRTEQPPFNLVNKRPETYYFIGITQVGTQLKFRLTTNPESIEEYFFGAFKGRVRVRDSYIALLRLIWASQTQLARFEYPAVLRRDKPPYEFSLMWSSRLSSEEQKKWMGELCAFLAGENKLFLKTISWALLTQLQIPKVYYSPLQDDLEQLEEFWEMGPKKNAHLKELFQMDSYCIAQEFLDDLLVKAQFYRKEASK